MIFQDSDNEFWPILRKRETEICANLFHNYFVSYEIHENVSEVK